MATARNPPVIGSQLFIATCHDGRPRVDWLL
jgi:hypothetical protein